MVSNELLANEPLIIVGGGLAGSLAALAIAERRPDQSLLLVEAGSSFGGNHIWSFFDGDVVGEGRPLIDAMQPIHWPTHSIRFPGRERTLSFGYNSVHSDKLDALVRERLAPSQWRLSTAVAALSPDGIVLGDGTEIAACGVIDARGPDGPMPGLDLAWQKFVGVEYDMPRHGLAAPIIMDTLVDQKNGYRFVYSLPFSSDRLLVEDTYYTEGPALDVPAIRQNVADYAAAQGWTGTPIREEIGLLPILLGGDPYEFWPASDDVARLGLKGGFFHPTTGYSLPQAAANAVALAEWGEFDGEAVAIFTRMSFLAHWQNTGFYRLLNRMLFGAARPEERVKVFNHFYRLDDSLVERFYAGRLTPFDKVRILSGKPPIPIFRAVKAILS